MIYDRPAGLKNMGTTSSIYKGVCFQEPTNKWYVHLFVSKFNRNLKYSASERGATRAYNEAATHYAGEFARLSEIDQLY